MAALEARVAQIKVAAFLVHAATAHDHVVRPTNQHRKRREHVPHTHTLGPKHTVMGVALTSLRARLPVVAHPMPLGIQREHTHVVMFTRALATLDLHRAAHRSRRGAGADKASACLPCLPPALQLLVSSPNNDRVTQNCIVAKARCHRRRPHVITLLIVQAPVFNCVLRVHAMCSWCSW